MSERGARKASLKLATHAVLGLYLAVYSITLASAAWGAPAFVRVATAVHPTWASALGMLAFALLLIDSALSVRPQAEDAPRAVQNTTLLITMMWLGGQLWSGVYSISAFGSPAAYLYTPLMSQLSSTGVLGVPWTALGQAIALPSAAFFVLSRVSTNLTPRARMAIAISGIAAMLFPLNGLVYVATGSRVLGPVQPTPDVPSAPCGSAR